MKQPKTKASPNRVWRSGNQLIKKVLTSWWTGNHAPPPGAAPQIFDLSRRQFCQRRNLKTQRFFSLPAPSPVSAKNQRFVGRGPCKETLFSLGNGIYKNRPAPRCIFALPESATPTRVFRRIPENRRNQPLQSMAAGFVCYPAAAGGCRPCRPAASGSGHCPVSLPRPARRRSTGRASRPARPDRSWRARRQRCPGESRPRRACPSSGRRQSPR